MSEIYKQIDDSVDNRPCSSGESSNSGISNGVDWFAFSRYSMINTTKKDPVWLKNMKNRREHRERERIGANRVNSSVSRQPPEEPRNQPGSSSATVNKPKRKRKSSTPVCRRDMIEESDDDDRRPYDIKSPAVIDEETPEEREYDSFLDRDEDNSSDMDEEMPQLNREETMNEIVMEETMAGRVLEQERTSPEPREQRVLSSSDRDADDERDDSSESSGSTSRAPKLNNNEEEYPAIRYRTRSKTVAERIKEEPKNEKKGFLLGSIGLELMKNAQAVIAMGSKEFVLPNHVWENKEEASTSQPSTRRKFSSSRIGIMGGADGAGPTSSASAAVEQFNWRRTPIISGNAADHEYWMRKEAEYNSLDPRVKARMLYKTVPTAMSILEKDWNHLQEVPIPGLEPFKELIRIYPKDIDTKRAIFEAGPQDFKAIRRLYGDPSPYAYSTGPVFSDTRVTDLMFNELFIQLTMSEFSSPGSEKSAFYGHKGLREIMNELNTGSDVFIPTNSAFSPYPAFPKLPLQRSGGGFEGPMEVGHFVPPVIQQEPQRRVVDRPEVNNLHRQVVTRQVQRNNSCHRGRGGRVMSTQRPRNGSTVLASTTIVMKAPAPPPPAPPPPPPAVSENRREPVVPIHVVVVDGETNGVNNNSGEGYYHITNNFRQWRGKRYNLGNSAKNTPNKIHFNRNL
uniref:JmjC domain-containing protein n=1 Tax=Caenorhabditis tropicalis TaxID=1561998 RepID=A0A1I7T0E4_9PELO